MNTIIPTYPLNILSQHDEGALDVFLVNQKTVNPKASVDIPYRSNYYGVGICIKGKAELKASLETYIVEPGCIVTMSPHIIKQWVYMSGDFENLIIFFTKEFITANNNISLDKFRFFESVAKHVFLVSAAQRENIEATLNFLQQKYGTHHGYRNEILKSGINILLCETASIYDRQSVAFHAVQSRSQLLASEFKKLVNIHFTTERSLRFYAEKLFISPKHLTETLKEVTGKTAGEWIDETIILEAKVLLQNPALTIAQVADMLNFPEQSSFGKFFKNITTLSPVAWKQSL